MPGFRIAAKIRSKVFGLKLAEMGLMLWNSMLCIWGCEEGRSGNRDSLSNMVSQASSFENSNIWESFYVP